MLANDENFLHFDEILNNNISRAPPPHKNTINLIVTSSTECPNINGPCKTTSNQL